MVKGITKGIPMHCPAIAGTVHAKAEMPVSWQQEDKNLSSGINEYGLDQF